VRPDNVVQRADAAQPSTMIGHLVLEGDVHAVVLLEAGRPVLRLNGTRYPMRRPNAYELGSLLHTAAKYDSAEAARAAAR
jgi:hypothetical protein